MEQIMGTGEMKTLIHFTHLQGDEWCIACMPNLRDLHAVPLSGKRPFGAHDNYQRSNDIRAVTCPLCIKVHSKGLW